MSSTVRVPKELYESLREIKVLLESEYQSAAPSMQDLVSLALKRLISDWDNLEEREELLEDLLEHRRVARSKMGNKKSEKS